MRSRRLIQVVGTVAVALSLVVGAKPAAYGKGDIKARLTAPLSLDASSGETITVAWKLYIVNGQVFHGPFNADGIFVRLHSASGAAATMAFATADAHPLGRYDAQVAVPDGGIGGIEIGIRGTTDVAFPLENDPFAGRAAESMAPASEPASGGSFPALLVLVGTFGVLSISAVLGLLARRGRPRGVDLRDQA